MSMDTGLYWALSVCRSERLQGKTGKGSDRVMTLFFKREINMYC